MGHHRFQILYENKGYLSSAVFITDPSEVERTQFLRENAIVFRANEILFSRKQNTYFEVTKFIGLLRGNAILLRGNEILISRERNKMTIDTISFERNSIARERKSIATERNRYFERTE